MSIAPLVADKHFSESPSFINEISEDDIEEIQEPEITKSSASVAPQGSSKPSVPVPAPDPGFGEISFGQSGSEEKLASLSDAPPRVSSLPAPLDEVIGRGFDQAEEETHEAFFVPVKKNAPAVLLDVTPRGLGVATAGGYCDIIIERNAAIPIEQSRQFSTSRHDQTEVFIDVYQGESRRTEENTQLGRIELTNIRPAPRGEISITVTFEIDTDGILNVKATNDETSIQQTTRIKLTGGLDEGQVKALVEKYKS